MVIRLGTSPCMLSMLPNIPNSAIPKIYIKKMIPNSYKMSKTITIETSSKLWLKHVTQAGLNIF
jgi:hypothetical protein